MGFKPYRSTLEHLVVAAWREINTGQLTYVCQCGETFTRTNAKEMFQKHRKEAF